MKYPASVVINGKFLLQSTTGVQRFAKELLLAVDKLLANEDWNAIVPFDLLIPVGNTNKVPKFDAIGVRETPSEKLFFWEQFILPGVASKDLLINLAGSAPLFKHYQICTFHDAAIFDFPKAYTIGFKFWYRFLFWIQSRFCLRVITVSQFSRQRLSFHLGVPISRISVVPNGASHFANHSTDCADDVISRLNITPKKYFLVVASDNPSKNIRALLQAFISIELPDLYLVIVGGRNSSVFSGASDDKPFSFDPRVICTGRLKDRELKSLYKNALAFVFPSLYEGFGIPPLEAMSCDCAVLASDIAAIPEVCGDAVGYFDPKSISSMKATLVRAYNDPLWIESLRQAGRERVKSYNWSHAAEQFLTVLSSFGVVYRNQP